MSDGALVSRICTLDVGTPVPSLDVGTPVPSLDVRMPGVSLDVGTPVVSLHADTPAAKIPTTRKAASRLPTEEQSTVTMLLTPSRDPPNTCRRVTRSVESRSGRSRS